MNRAPFMALNLLMIFSPSACTAASTSPPDVSQHPLSQEAASSSNQAATGQRRKFTPGGSTSERRRLR